MSKSPPRVLGPYPNRRGFRLVVLAGDRRKSVTAPTHPGALALKQELQRELQREAGQTIAQALDEYRDHALRVRGVSASTAAQTHRTLTLFLPVDCALTALTGERAARLYRAETERITRRGTPVAVDSHRLLLRRARAFCGWARERGYLRDNPFAAVIPMGQTRAGKPQLRIDEARRFLQVALGRAEQGDALAAGVLLMLLLGLRAGEVLRLLVRDVDDDAQVLWVSRGKTRSARRRLRLPGVLQPLLRRLLSGKEPQAFLLGTTRTGRPKHAEYLWQKVGALCAAAEVPRVCPHSLRGLHSTLAIAEGATADLVAAALGHRRFAITARHYTDPDTLLAAQARRVSDALGPLLPRPGAGAGELDPDAISDALRAQLTAAQLEQLRQRLFGH